MLTLLPLLAFAVVSLLVVAGAMALAPSSSVTVEQRLFEVAGRRVAANKSDARKRVTERALTVLGRLSPKSPSEMGELQRRLVCAGYRNTTALPIFIGLRVGIAITAF